MLDASQTELTLEATQNIRVGIEETLSYVSKRTVSLLSGWTVKTVGK